MNFRVRLCSAIVFGLFLSAQSAALAQDTNNEPHMIGVLQSQSSPQEKDAACVWLKRNGTAQSVPALAALLNDEQLSHSARYALESMPGPEAGHALIAALAQTSGLQKVGVINSLGIRREAGAVTELGKLVADPDEQIERVSAASLGDIASPEALKMLENRLDSDGPAHAAVVDGCLRCANHFLETGDRKKALAVYDEIYQRHEKEFFHVAAYRGLVLASGARGLDLIANAITNGPASLQMEALQLVHEVQIPGASKAAARLLSSVDPLVQIALIDALSQRDDPAAAPEIEALARQASSDSRTAAVGALGNLGDDKNIPLLIAIAATAGDPAQASARQALTLIHRGTSNRTLVDLLRGSKPEAQMEIIRALSNRSQVEAVPKLFELAQKTDDPVRDASFQALARMVKQPQLDELAKIIPQMTTDAGRASAAGALVAACRRIQRQNGTVDMTPVWAALRNGSPKTRIALLPVCSSLAEPETREILRAALADRDPEIHAAAVRALCDTMDAALVPDVAKLAGDPSDKEFRTLAIESCVRLTTQEDSINIPGQERIKLLQALISVAESPAEKRVILAGLSSIPTPSSLQLAQPFLSDVTVSNEAARSVIGICRKLPDAQAARAALEQLNSSTASNQTRQDADAALKMVMARADYITAWEFAGPYSQAGQNYTRLFDITFPPETAGATNINWRDLPSSDDPDHAWVMDLLKAIGGEQEVAYARTSIHSDNEQEAVLALNSDDGVKVWFNGKVIVARNIARALNGPADKVKITLKAGWNDLLFKVTQNNAGWGFWAKLTDSVGAKLKGVQYEASPGHSPM